MTTRIRFRRGTAAEWTSANPILALGEVGIETDTSKIKAGDNVTDWASLPYVFDSAYTDISDLQSDVTALQALPIATRSMSDVADISSGIIVRILQHGTAVGLTTAVLSQDTIYAALYEPTAGELAGTEQLDTLQFLVTADGGNCHIGIWVLDGGMPNTLIADSGELTSTVGLVAWTSIGFTPDPGKLYAVGVVVNTATTVRALSQNGAKAWGLDTAFGTSAYSHMQGSHSYAALADFPTPSPSSGAVPAFGATYVSS